VVSENVEIYTLQLPPEVPDGQITGQQFQVKSRILGLRRQLHGLVLNVDRCVLGVEQLKYLGHQVSTSGIQPLASRVEALRRFLQPATMGQLQTFLDVMNFYRRFIPGAAGVLRPLTDMCRGGQTERLEWTKAMAATFSSSKKAICEAAELAHPRADASLF
jgi:hypothetical protein